MGSIIRSLFRAFQQGQRRREKGRRALDMMAKRELQIIDRSYQLILSTKTLRTMRVRFDAIDQALARLSNLERQYRVRTAPTAAELKARYDGLREESILAFYKRSIGLNIEKAQVVTSKPMVHRLLDKCRMLIVEAKNDLKDKQRADELTVYMSERGKEIDWNRFQ